MQVIVMGAGVVGVSSAWYLAKMGHEVTVIDRASAAAMETSFANAGQLSYGYTTPWAAPGIPTRAARWLFKKHAPLIIRPDGSLYQLQWLWKMLKNCNDKSYAINKSRMVRISEYSRQLLDELLAEESDLHFDQRRRGTLQIFRSEEEQNAAKEDIRILQDYGVAVTEIHSAAECAQYEPALAKVAHKLAGALYIPNDGTGDCHKFTQALAQKCQALGVKFLFNATIDNIIEKNGAVSMLIVNGESMRADHYLCSLGSFSRQLMQKVGIDLPIYPVKGYSLTLPILNEEAAPVSTVLDETHKVAITRFDDRIRVGGMAELSGYQLRLPLKHKETLTMVTQDLFPSAADHARAEFWSGLRPMTPDSTPIIGASRLSNLSLNCGHGTLGWTMCLGSGKLIADQISGHQPDIASADLSMIRYA